MIKVKIGSNNKELQNGYDDKGYPVATSNLNIRRDMTGNYIVYDHVDINIIILTKRGVIFTMPKSNNGNYDDISYGAQNRFFRFMSEQGIVDPATIQGSNIIGTLEAKILKPKRDNLNPIQVTVFAIDKFMNEEKPYFQMKQTYEEREEERMMNPDEEHSTELGEVPQQDQQGGVDPNYRGVGAFYTIYETKNFAVDGKTIIFTENKEIFISNNKKKWKLSNVKENDIKMLYKILSSEDEMQKQITLSEVMKGYYGGLRRVTAGQKAKLPEVAENGLFRFEDL
jgi:hypothetical protein